MSREFLQILHDWVSNNCLTQIKDLFEKTSAYRDFAKRADLVNTCYRVADGIKTTLLLTACEKGFVEVVDFLVTRCGADVDRAGDILIGDTVVEGVPPLWLACNKNIPELVALLLLAKATANASTKKTRSTPLRAACHGGHLNLVKMLVAAGANCELANWRDNTCLMVACLRGYYEIVEFFVVERKVDINRPSFDGHTALHDAAENGDMQILKLLLACGAISKPNNANVTPVLVAAMNGHDEAVKLLSKGLSKDKASEALELLGAKKICVGLDAPMLTRSLSHNRIKASSAAKATTSKIKEGLDCWFSALEMRQSVLSRYNKQLGDIKPRPVYNNIIEFRNAKEFHALRRDIESVYFTALIICERILGLQHPFTYKSIREVAVHFGKLRKFKTCFMLCLHAVDIHLLNLDPFCDDTFHIFKCCVNLFFAFKFDDQPSLIAECRPIIVDLYDRILKQLNRIHGTVTGISDAKKSLINGYFSLGLHVLSILSEESSIEYVYPLIEKIARIPLPHGIKVFLAMSIMSQCEGTDVVDWNAVGSVSKRFLADVASKSYKIAKGSSSDSAPLNSSLPLDDQYHQIQILSEGYFSRAILAYRSIDNVQIVLKEIHLSSLHPADKKRIVDEAKTLLENKNRHPSVVQFFKVFDEEQRVLIEMEFCTGGDMATLISKHKAEGDPFPERIIRAWIAQLVSGLKFLHDNGIVHGNIKSKSTLIDSEWKVKLGQICTGHKLTKRKVRYAAPEVAEKKQPYGKKADVWSLGFLSFELATFQEPVAELKVDLPMFKRTRVPFPANAPYSQGFRRFVEKLLASRPDQRPDVCQLLEDKILLNS